MKKVIITGGAGFIGSNLVKKLIDESHDVLIIDNLVLGKKEFLFPFMDNPRFKFVNEDLIYYEKIKSYFKDIDLVIHLAANSDISLGAEKTNLDLNSGTIATYNTLEAMRINHIDKIIFSSSSAVYGEATIKPTPENYGPLFPMSFYGASKLACEGLISAFSHNYGIKAWIYRFANIVGPNSTHGVIVDFIRKLSENNLKLEILGNGKQKKPYLHVDDCISGMLYGYNNSTDNLNYFNLTPDDTSEVDFIANCLFKRMGLKNVEKEYTGGQEGWKGDVPQVRLDASKLKKLGWTAKNSSNEAIEKAISDLVKQINV